MLRLYSILCLTLVVSCATEYSEKSKTLLLSDSTSYSRTHSEFMQLLEDGSFVKQQSMYSKFMGISKMGDNLFDNLVIFYGDETDEAKISVRLLEILTFIDQGGNVILLCGGSVKLWGRKLINQIGYQLLPAGVFLSSVDSENKIIVLDADKHLVDAEPILTRKSIKAPVVYTGSALKYDSRNKKNIQILTASDEHQIYSSAKDLHYPSLIDERYATLVGATTMNNDGRALIIPSIDFASDKLLQMPYKSRNAKVGGADQPTTYSNRELLRQLVSWTFREKSILRISKPQHVSLETYQSKKPYTVMETIRYSVLIEEKTRNGWVPYKSGGVEFRLHRMITHLTMDFVNHFNGTYSVTFELPDYIGLFKCMTLLNTTGLTEINHYTQIVVSPVRLTGATKFVLSSWIYYLTCFLMVFLSYGLIFVISQTKEKME